MKAYFVFVVVGALRTVAKPLTRRLEVVKPKQSTPRVYKQAIEAYEHDRVLFTAFWDWVVRALISTYKPEAVSAKAIAWGAAHLLIHSYNEERKHNEVLAHGWTFL